MFQQFNLSLSNNDIHENMAYVLGHMQLNWVLGLSVVAILLWLGTLPPQVSSVSHLFSSTSPSCSVSSSVDLVLIPFQRWILPTYPVIEHLATIFKIFYITFIFPSEIRHHFQLEMLSSHKFKNPAIHIRTASFKTTAESSMNPQFLHPVFFSVSSVLENKWSWNLLNFSMFSFCVITIMLVA